MARRYHEIKGLAEFTAKTIVSDEEQWKKFLHTDEESGFILRVQERRISGQNKPSDRPDHQGRVLGCRSRFPTPGNPCHLGGHKTSMASGGCFCIICRYRNNPAFSIREHTGLDRI